MTWVELESPVDTLAWPEQDTSATRTAWSLKQEAKSFIGDGRRRMLLERWDFFVFPTITGEIVSIKFEI